MEVVTIQKNVVQIVVSNSNKQLTFFFFTIETVLIIKNINIQANLSLKSHLTRRPECDGTQAPHGGFREGLRGVKVGNIDGIGWRQRTYEESWEVSGRNHLRVEQDRVHRCRRSL